MNPGAYSLVGAGAGLGWLVLVFCEKKTLLAGWFGLAETNKRTGYREGFGRRTQSDGLAHMAVAAATHWSAVTATDT